MVKLQLCKSKLFFDTVHYFSSRWSSAGYDWGPEGRSLVYIQRQLPRNYNNPTGKPALSQLNLISSLLLSTPMYASTETNNWEITIFLGPIIYLLRMYQVPNYKSKQHVPVICISQHIVKPLCIKNWQYSWRCELYISFYSFMTIMLGSVLWGFRIIKMKKKGIHP